MRNAYKVFLRDPDVETTWKITEAKRGGGEVSG
jgi:hypothetical protein